MNRRSFIQQTLCAAGAIAVLGPLTLEAPGMIDAALPFAPPLAPTEDLLDLVTIINPVETPLMNMIAHSKSKVYTEWLSDALEPAA